MINNDIIIYDGVCVMCNSFFRWVHKNDKKNIFMFSNFQSKYSLNNMDKLKNTDSIAVVLKDGGVLRKTEAVYYILKKTNSFLAARFLIFVIPYPISNMFYDFIASIRYNIFGKYDSCPILDNKYKLKFID
jgi:predicted DCC family thiol-disulfide oxidoreductase YuxK|tara:strand:- start:6 stop:398 length:393 start_codon:yes stop_codon:yes gene_type:complete